LKVQRIAVWHSLSVTACFIISETLMGFLFQKFVRPALFRFEAETAHDIGMASLRFGLATRLQRDVVRSFFEVPEFSPIDLFGLRFNNPLGMAAGFDKNGRVVNQLAALGFSFVEAGTVTPIPQKGNPRPRLFRIPEDGAIVNRLGFNNDGVDSLVERISSIERECVLGINIGKNKDVSLEDAPADYLHCFRKVREVADYVVVNVSSPNTPGLRNLQAISELERILDPLLVENKVGSRVPILLKIAPDLVAEEFEALADFAVSKGLDGLVLTNTTISRPSQSGNYSEIGGLSGRPLSNLSDEAIRLVYKRVGEKLPIIGVGGIASGEDILRKIRLGASLLQVYTGFVYGGPGFPSRILWDFRRILEKLGVSELGELRGQDL
jgi:dihydroorotate dehydrogenase